MIPADECALRVRRAIASAQRLPLDAVTDERTFAELGIGSLDAINLQFVLEEEFGITLPYDHPQPKTIGEAIAALAAHLAHSAPPELARAGEPET